MKDSYAELKSSLEKILDQMQDPQTGLDNAIRLHAEAKKIMQKLEKYLADADSKIKKAKDS